MKVIHLISGGDSGGARTHVHLLLKKLNQDMEARLVCFMDGPFARDAAALGIPTLVLDQGMGKALRTLRRMIAEEGVDLVHCHGSRGNLMGALLKPHLGDIPVISTVHSDPKLDYLGRPAARLTYGNLNALALRRMDAYVGVSDAMRALLISRGFDPNSIYTIYNGIEFRAPRPCAPEEKRAYLARLGLRTDADSVVVGIAARLDPVKDMPTLLRGFAQAKAEQPQLRLVIAGEGKERENLGALAQSLGVADAVCFAGWVSDMENFYRAIDINALTSLSETFPYALTEGARECLPAVSTRVGGVPALIEHGVTGYLIAPGDAAALGKYLAKLAAEPAERARLGQALHDKAARDFSADATCRRQEEIYRRVLERRERFRANGRCGALICGAYGMHNAGDEAVLDAVVAEMRTADPVMPVTVLSRMPRAAALRCGVQAVHSFRFLTIWRLLRRREVCISGGGSLIQDVTSSRSLWYYLFILRAAKARGCRVMMYGCGVGPVRLARHKRMAGAVIDRCVDAATLRETHSLEELRSFGVERPELILAADPALRLDPAPPAAVDTVMRELGLDPAGRYFCLCVRRWPEIRHKAPLFAAAADYVHEAYGLTPLLLTVNEKQDAGATEAVRALVKTPCVSVRKMLDTPEMIGLLERMELVMAMRLHVLIFAAARGVPLAGVSYDPKVAAFLDDIAQSAYVDYAALERPEQLRAVIDAAAGTDRAALAEHTARMRALEGRNLETVRRLLGREDVKEDAQ